MEHTNNTIELKRGICKICEPYLADKISDLNDFESFYKNVFQTYDVSYDAETIRQKREFVSAITKYFILDRLPQKFIKISVDAHFQPKIGLSSDLKSSEVIELLKDIINKYYKIQFASDSSQDFMQKYAEYHNEEVKDFSEEISQNRDDSLSDFAKAIQNVYNYRKGNKLKK